MLTAYTVGDHDTRPWGSYSVTKTERKSDGTELVEKTINVNARQVLSLQSHAMREELWTALRGNFTALVDGTLHHIATGQSIAIPLGAIHSIINTGDACVEIHEIQRGICREDDIIRYCDAHGRATKSDTTHIHLARSLELYKSILNDLNAQA